MKNRCNRCGRCCKFMILWLPHDAKKDYLRWIGYHKGVSVVTYRQRFALKGFKAIRIEAKCKHLLKNNLCAIYKNRPKVCREYNCWDGDFPAP